ncbi:MAG TPA: tungsten ABC transporter substrate-binding protein [Methylococcaceae bacterium]|nr:tungsten ABC transporter substrate-binding protein [Methylococcaceae bacterium]HIN67838.1 tungsten ABC transporter substrate-binding protein [Methylococcales bacterium]HIO12077.1 tungsten ABC transporter substrate-binding protein [Methylococcales bacterium]
MVKRCFIVFICSGLFFSVYAEEAAVLRVATTTSTENSGLLSVLHPAFENQKGVRLDVIAVGTGKALRLGENGDVDVILVHAPVAEVAFVDAGFGVHREAVMHNDFVIVGPSDDPLGLRQLKTLSEVMKKISSGQSVFISRGDDSGTHKKEIQLWQQVGINPEGQWYSSVGQGMGAVLRMADDRLAYTLTDRGTYLAYQGKVALEIGYQGDLAFNNPYHVMAINPKKHPHVHFDLARQYINYLISAEGQAIINDFRRQGQVLFYGNSLP